MRRKIWGILGGLLLFVLFSGGCMAQQMSMVETIRTQDEISVEELRMLARTEELKFTKSVQWQPEGEKISATVLTDDGGRILLVWDSAQVDGGRAAIEQAGWQFKNWWSSEEKPAVVQQAIARFGEAAMAYSCSTFTAKNLLIYALVPQTIAVEYGADKPIEIARRDFNASNLTKLRALFWWDINEMQAKRYYAANDHYMVEVVEWYYSAETKPALYDNVVQYTVRCQPLDHEAFVPNETITVMVSGLLADKTMTMSATITDITPETFCFLQWGPELSTTAEPLVPMDGGSVTIIAGGITETLSLMEIRK